MRKKISVLFAVTVAVLMLFSASALAEQPKASAKSLFYDPNAAGTVQMPTGDLKPETTRLNADGNPVNPVSNYYDNLNPGVRYWIELLRPGSGYVKRVSNDRVFRSGDRIRIHVSTNADGYMHLLLAGTTGSRSIIPVSSNPKGAVQMGEEYVIPANGGWLLFDENPGKEELTLVYASVRSSNEVAQVVQNAAVNNASFQDRLFALSKQFAGSNHTITQVQSGTKDLVLAGAQTVQSPPPPRQQQAPAQQFNINNDSRFHVNETIYNAPANYVVNTTPGKVKEPVIVRIVLNHHP